MPPGPEHGFSPEVRKRFQYWQTRTIIATMVGYALFYFVRKNFSFAMTGMETDLGISKTSLGIFLTLHGLIYGLSRFLNGVLADRVNARFFMASGLALCALANFAFGFGEDISTWITGETGGSQFTNTLILFMGLLWVANGWLQGMGFPPCARLLTHWIPPNTAMWTKAPMPICWRRTSCGSPPAIPPALRIRSRCLPSRHRPCRHSWATPPRSPPPPPATLSELPAADG